MNKVLFVSLVLLAVSGCKYVPEDKERLLDDEAAMTRQEASSGGQSKSAHEERQFDDKPIITLKEYVDDLRRAAVVMPTPEERDLFPNEPELLPDLTTHYIKRDFQVVYIDKRYVSFRADMEDYHGGNGNHSQVIVGTIDRKTGRILGVVDFVPKDKWPTLKRKLYEGAAKKVGGQANLLREVEVIENFYFDEDGLHFVYEPYEIAGGAIGAVDVVVDLKVL